MHPIIFSGKNDSKKQKKLNIKVDCIQKNREKERNHSEKERHTPVIVFCESLAAQHITAQCSATAIPAS